ncbi:MAG TPA: TetR/AcrR family transcriptional regulator [Candidatus Stackebrandtia faecavium]|nr:TetR/AcrR family transcriptional regulator [Candidatus Stackebrandtia faecavium]
MATDTRTLILEAAKELAESNLSVEGVTISFESVAQRTGLTKPGIMYHFPTKEALMRGLVEHAGQRWHALLHERAGAAPDRLSVFDRHRAYIWVATTSEVSRADYWILSGALYHSALTDSWNEYLGPWHAADGLGAQARSLLTAARFCADGAWMSEATGVFTADDLSAVHQHALKLINDAEKLEGNE